MGICVNCGHRGADVHLHANYRARGQDRPPQVLTCDDIGACWHRELERRLPEEEKP